MDKCPNYAFIDGNNLHLGTQFEGWKPHYGKLRAHLYNRFSIQKAYYFMGYIPNSESYHNLYHSLLKAGFILKFKRTKTSNKGFRIAFHWLI